MNNRINLIIAVTIALVAPAWTGMPQGTFLNLDFENPILPLDPNDPNGVPIANALPGWVGYTGSNPVRCFYNTISLGAAAISLQGPGSSFTPIQGSYSVFLQGQFNPNQIPGLPSAAIAQTGQVPSNAQALIFWGLVPSGFQLTFEGQVIPWVQLGTTPNYRILGADITALAGRSGEFRFTTFSGDGAGAYFDNIQFSDQAIPEPSVLGLLGLGALLCGWPRFRSG